MTKPNMLLRSQQISDAEWHVHIDDHVMYSCGIMSIWNMTCQNKGSVDFVL